MEELSEPILQHILSFLNFTDLIRASAVSKGWRTAVSTLHSLIVTDDFFRPLNLGNGGGDDFPVIETNKSRKEKVRSMLISAGCFIVKAKEQDLHFNKLIFKFRGKFSYFIPYLMQCVSLHGNVSVREFVLEVGNKYYGGVSKYSLPAFAYAGHFLQKLVVGGLKLSLGANARVNLPCLRELHLRRSRIGDEYLEQLIMNSPQLEIIKMRNCFGFHAFKVLGSHQKLKWVEVLKYFHEDDQELYPHYSDASQEIHKVEIKEAPNVKVFRYSSNGYDTLEVLDLAVCKNLKVLELSSLYGNDDLLKSIEQLVSDLKNLEAFSLHQFTWSHSYDGLRSFKISSNSLRELWLAFTDSPMDVQVDAPHVSEIFYLGLMSSNLSLGTSLIKDANFVKWDGDSVMSGKLVEFLSTFNHIEAVKLEDFAPHDLVIPKHLRSSLDPPLWDIKHLTVGSRYAYDIKYKPINLDMLESLLWMAPHLDSLCFAQFIADSHLKTTITFQFMHGNHEINLGEVLFISPRDKLVKVKVESCPCDVEGLELKKYSFFDGGISMEGEVKRLEFQVMSKGHSNSAGLLQEGPSKMVKDAES